MLSDRNIYSAIKDGKIKVGGVEGKVAIGPASVDLHLDNKAQILQATNMSEMEGRVLDIKKDNSKSFHQYNGWHRLIIKPGDFYVLSTIEKIELNSLHSGFVHGRSSLARLGLNIHMAGFVDPGFCGNITLEVTNFTKIPIVIYHGTRIGQMTFMKLDSPSEIDYGSKLDSKYQGQEGPTLSRSNEDTYERKYY